MDANTRIAIAEREKYAEKILLGDNGEEVEQ